MVLHAFSVCVQCGTTSQVFLSKTDQAAMVPREKNEYSNWHGLKSTAVESTLKNIIVKQYVWFEEELKFFH